MPKHKNVSDWITTFLSRIEVKAIDECWPWKGCIHKNRGGYGVFATTCIDGKRKVYKAHRLSFWLAVRQPVHIHVLHKCDNPQCVNPSHLYAGNDADNFKDMVERRRYRGLPPIYPYPNSKLTVDQVREIFLSHEKAVMLARKFNLDKSTINLIKARKTWTEVTKLLL